MLHKIIPPKVALMALRSAFNADHDYAHTWFCNLAVMAQDAGAPHKESQDHARGFMKRAFTFDITDTDYWEREPQHRTIKESE